MLSIIPGTNATNDNFSLFASATQPKNTGKTGKFQKSGRRLVNSAPSGQYAADKKEEERRLKFNNNASIDELDKMLEDDALALLNIRKEISQAQADELEKIRLSVLAIKKEHDTYHVANNMKEKQLFACIDQYNSLVGVDQSTMTTQNRAKSQMDELTEQTMIVLDDLSAEQRTIKMQNLMMKRLEDEIGKCRIDISKATITLEHAKHDLVLAENNLQLNRQYLLEQENQFEKLTSTLKTRKDQRDNKINMLHTLSLEGEQSVAKLQSSLNENSKKLSTFNKTRKATALTAKSNKQSNQADDDDFQNDESDFAVRARRMNIYQIKEAIQRYQTQTMRVEKLTQLDQELRTSLQLQQKKKLELSEHLSQTQFKIQQLASARQIYQEVDLKDSTLAATSKECEEAKEKDFRLKLNIEELKQSIPRFLTKVTKVVHPKPTENQLPDAILKLEDEVIKLIKVIGSALLKDATQDDLAVISQQSAAATGGNNDTNSEFARLQRLPGFSRMQRQLFFNMMTARPDISDHNIRISNAKVKKPIIPDQPRVKKVRANDTVSLPGSDNTSEKGETSSFNFDQTEEAAMGRATIKNISRLIIERDVVRVKSAAANEVGKRL